MQRWDLDGFVVTENQGYFDIEGIDRLPPGWYSIDLRYDRARNTPTLSVTPVDVAVDMAGGEDNNVTAVVSRPNSDTCLVQVVR
jgi:hypothetical protein